MQDSNESTQTRRKLVGPAVALLAVLTIGAVAAPATAAAQDSDTTSVPTTELPPTTVTEPPVTTEVPTTVPATPTTIAPAPATEPTPPTTAAPAPEAAAVPEARAVKGPRNLAAATYPYSPREVKLAWNNSHRTKIKLPKAAKLAAYLNAVVEAKLRQYLLAVYLNAVARATVPGQSGWERVAACESGGRWNLSTGNGYYGGLQFSARTWRSVGGRGLPHQNSKAEQMRRANILKSRAGLGQWPHCGRRFHG